MELAQQLIVKAAYGFGQMLAQPFYYLGIVAVILLYRRQIVMERKLFHVRLHSLWSETWRAVLFGAAAGLAASAVMIFVGAAVSPESIYLLWGMMLLLSIARYRFLCLSYAVGVVGLLHAMFAFFPAVGDIAGLSWLARAVEPISLPSLLAAAGVLHLIEALLVRRQAARTATPLFYVGKRGKLVGGYHIQGFWPVPLLLLVPVGGAGLALPWPTLLGDALAQSAWMFVPFPVVLGFADKTVTRLPQAKTRWSSNLLLIYALIVLVLAWISSFWPILIGAAALLTALLHEAMIWLGARVESQRSPRFVHDERGLTVLAVVPHSPAAEMGLLAGEVIRKVNGVPVREKEELYQALQLNSAFCKLEVINLDGQSRFAQRALFAGDHHQLGVVLAPDEQAAHFAQRRSGGLFGYLAARRSGLGSRSRTM